MGHKSPYESKNKLETGQLPEPAPKIIAVPYVKNPQNQPPVCLPRIPQTHRR